MSAFAEHATKPRKPSPIVTQEIEYTIIGSLLTRPELFPQTAFLDRADFNDPRMGDAFAAISMLNQHGQTINNLTVAACAAGLVPAAAANLAEHELGSWLVVIQADRGYRRNLEAEATLLRKHRLNRERIAAATREDWITVKRIGEDIAALDKPKVAATLTAAELWAKEFPPLNWLVDGVLPEGVTLLCSPPKVGKTRLATQLAIALANGGYALNNPDTRAQKTGVLLLALESGDRRSQKDS